MSIPDIALEAFEAQLTLEQHGFELCGQFFHGFVSIVNTTALRDLELAESSDVEPWIRSSYPKRGLTVNYM